MFKGIFEKGIIYENMHSSSHSFRRRIGFVSTRFDGTDGVSLETRKWAHVLQGLGHSAYYFASVSDQPNTHYFMTVLAVKNRMMRIYGFDNGNCLNADRSAERIIDP